MVAPAFKGGTDDCRRGLIASSTEVARGLLAVLFGLYALVATAQNFASQHWSTQNGLPAATITAMSQTVDGDLWVGTRRGLARFDGSQFRMFTPPNLPWMAYLPINSVAVGPDSTLYIGTDRGFTVIRRGQAQSFLVQKENRFSRVQVTLPIGQDEAWVATIDGHLFHYEKGVALEVDVGGVSLDAIYGMTRMPDGTLWIATGQGLFYLSQRKLSRYQPATPLPSEPFYDLVVSPDGTLFAASGTGLFGIRGDTWRFWNKDSGLPDSNISALGIGADGEIWVGTRKGLARLDKGVVHLVTEVSCSVRGIFSARGDSVWAGCEDSGDLFRLAKTAFRFVPLSRPLRSAYVSLADGSDGTVWMGTREGLYKYANGRFNPYTPQGKLSSNRIMYVSSDRSVLWLVTEGGLDRLEDGRVTSVLTSKRGAVDFFHSVQETADQTLWVTSYTGLSRRLPGHTAFENIPGMTNAIHSMREGQAGVLWVSTDSQGLQRFSGENQTSFTMSCGLGSNTVYGSAEDGSGTVWAWTSGGLSRIRDSRCKNLGAEGGLPDGAPGSIAYEGKGKLLLRTGSGVAEIDLQEANQALDSGGMLKSSRFFGNDRGLDNMFTDTQFLSLNVLNHLNEVWMPTSHGIAVLDRSFTPNRAAVTRTVVTRIASDAGDHDLNSPVNIKPGDTHIAFGFSVPFVLGTANRQYRYRLIGFDRDWRLETERKEADYTALPPGTYRFQVSSRNPFENWGAFSEPVTITVLPRFYQTLWWYTLVGLFVCSVLVLSFWFRLRVLQRSYAEMLAVRFQERWRLSRELHDTLSRGMMTVHMKIQLASALLRSEPDQARSHLQSAVGIIRQSSDETRRSIAALRLDTQETISLQNTIDKAVLTFKENSSISLKTYIDDDLPQVSDEVSHEITRIVEEALANVRLHSMAGEATLDLYKSKRTLRINVQDNGRGFDVRLQDAERDEHFGLTGMKERAQRIGGSLDISSVPGEGTRLMFEIPFPDLRRHGN